MTIGKFIFVVLLISGFVFLVWFSVSSSSHKIGAPKRIPVKVTLKNLCDLDEKTFIAREPQSRTIAHFKNGVAYMNVYSNRKITLAVSPHYPDFEYSGTLVPVAPEVTLVADCSVSPRQERILDLMREQFKN